MHKFGLAMVTSAGMRFGLFFLTMASLCAMMCYKDQSAGTVENFESPSELMRFAHASSLTQLQWCYEAF